MDKITFEDLPSTNTPINSNNLNQMQTNVESAITDVDSKLATETSYKNPFNGCYIRKYNGFVEMKISGLASDITMAGWAWSTSLGSLPEGYRPNMQIEAPVFAETASSAWLPVTLQISKAGSVELRNRSGNSVTVNKDHFCVYLTFPIGG